ncbi:hypothetical protein J4573_15645 [Actinomadura barringtoniae]|uniref:Uncharacterized protein n=1 Tax=Actinomadura barringtoniae TaxID=1427535 RepID=A0A939T1Y7_9ACTN|nr:hypothetical protein [Actinomadura barringtoniae]MBO2448536.1 hypothetical protein [Actinomadura barringtoniae]
MKFAQCMRANGIDVPDPKPGDKAGWRLEKGQDRGKLEGALKKCQGYLQAGGKMPDLKDPKVRDAMTRFAQCMREHGVDMPDPGPDGSFKVGGMAGVSQEKAEKARDACRSFLPGDLGKR